MTETSTPGTSPRRERAIVIAISLAALALRLVGIEHESLWVDELVSMRTARASLSEIVTHPYDPNLPGLYYVLLHFVLRAGDAEWLVRLPSALASVLSVPLLYTIVKKWTDARSASIAALLFAASPLHVWYAQETRPYALLVLLGLASLACVVHEKRAAFVLAATALFYVHLVALGFLAFLALLVIATVPRERWRGWIVAAGCVVLLALPGLVRARLLQPDVSADSTRSVSLVYLPYTAWTFLVGYSLGPSTTELHLPGKAARVAQYLPVIVPVLAFYGALAGCGLVRLFRERRRVAWATLGWLACPVLFAVAGSLVTVHPFNVRYAMLAAPALLVLVAEGTASLGRGRTLAVLGALAISAASLANGYSDERYHREDNRAAGRDLTANARSGDLVLVCASYTYDAFTHYVPRKDLVVVGLDAVAPLESDTLVRRATADPDEIDVTPELLRLTDGRARAWLFLSRTYHGDRGGRIRRFFETEFVAVRRSGGAGVELVLYERAKRNQKM